MLFTYLSTENNINFIAKADKINQKQQHQIWSLHGRFLGIAHRKNTN